MVIQTILKKASYNNSRSMRYDTDFLMECLLLRIRSKQAYLKIRERKLLPLPSLSTIRRLLSCMPCSFGKNEFALQAIQRNLQGKPKAMRYGSLIWDEMAIKEDLVFNSQKLQFDGHVDFGDEIVITKHADQLADHTLLFVFRPYLSTWIQPFAVYATKGAAPGKSLHELICKAIVALRSHGAIVKSVVCDGAQSNKTVMHLFGVTGKSDDSEHTFTLPADVNNNSLPTNGLVNQNCESVDPANTEIIEQDDADLEDWPDVECAPNNGRTFGEKENSQHESSFEHLLEEGERIYFFVDVPHLFKCVRNYIFNKKQLQVIEINQQML
jgi:hypothetical protein